MGKTAETRTSMNPQVQDRYVTANGLRFHYREWGVADCPSVLVLHGLSGHSWEWDRVAADLADRFHVVALDQRGHGASDWADNYAADRMATDIAAIADALGLDRVRVIGHSMGAINAYLCAARYPSLIERLVIVDVGPDTMVSEWAVNTFHSMLQGWADAVYASPEEAVADYLSGGPTPHDEELSRFVLHNLRQCPDSVWTWRFDAAGLRSWLTESPDTDAQWAAIQQVACPALVVRAGASPVLSAATAERMSRELQRGHWVEIANGWHDVHINRFDALMQEIRPFLTTK